CSATVVLHSLSLVGAAPSESDVWRALMRPKWLRRLTRVRRGSRRSLECSCRSSAVFPSFFFFQAEDGIRDWSVTGVHTCALPILKRINKTLLRRRSRNHRRGKGDAADQHRFQRLRTHTDAAEQAEVRFDSAGIPEF